MGRTAIFEFTSGPTVRKYVSAKADGQKIRQAAVHDGMKSLRESGTAKVIEGVTSLEELQRVLAPARAKKTVSGGKRK
jgi:type II secretory ATPase GspE/PulE/Tfp pilus assembly ATPase PilB-like protein